jgi:hypothetical protein
MDQKETIRKLWRLFSEQKWDESKSLFHPDFKAIWPQSKEVFLGAENFVEMNREYPGHHIAEILHLLEEGSIVSCTAFISADTEQTAFASSFFEFKDDLISRPQSIGDMNTLPQTTERNGRLKVS